MPTNDPESIARDLALSLTRIGDSLTLSNQVKRDAILFVDRVVEVAEQAFREMLRFSIEIRYLPDDGLSKDDIRRLRREADMLEARDRFRDVQFICGRLHVLSDQLRSGELWELLQDQEDQVFFSLLNLMNEHEGYLVRVAQDFMWAIRGPLQRLETTVTSDPSQAILIMELKQLSAKNLECLQRAIAELQRLHNQILPTSGGRGMLDVLLERTMSTPTPNVTIHGGVEIVGRDKKIAGRDFVETGRDLIQGVVKPPTTIEEARHQLLDAVKDMPPERRDIVSKQIDGLVDAINKRVPLTDLQAKAVALEMFLDSGKKLVAAPVKAAWTFIKSIVTSKS